MQWMLDDGPFGMLAMEFDQSWEWSSGLLVMAREVAASTDKDKSGRRQQLLSLVDADGQASTSVIDGGTLANDMLWSHLRSPSSNATKDIGEDASMAICATELDSAVFVTMDKRAAYAALAELGRARVAAPCALAVSCCRIRCRCRGIECDSGVSRFGLLLLDSKLPGEISACA